MASWKFPLESNTWTRLFSVSATAIRPWESTATWLGR